MFEVVFVSILLFICITIVTSKSICVRENWDYLLQEGITWYDIWPKCCTTGRVQILLKASCFEVVLPCLFLKPEVMKCHCHGNSSSFLEGSLQHTNQLDIWIPLDALHSMIPQNLLSWATAHSREKLKFKRPNSTQSHPIYSLWADF